LNIAQDTSRFKVVVTGRRWGKSVLGREVALHQAFNHANSLTWIVTPTREMGKDIHWTQLKRRCEDLNWNYKVNETELSITNTDNNSKIFIKTADKPDRLRGRGLDLVIPDEFASMDQSVWSEILRPALSDKKGKALFISTPAGHDVLYELYKNSDKETNWRGWHYKTIDSPFIDADEIEQARKELDERTFKQEYEASFDTGGNPPYYAFNTTLNASQYQLQTNIPLIVACDFNATEKPMSWVIGQRLTEYGQDVTHWTKAFSYTFTNTSTMSDILLEYLKDYSFPAIIFYGDYAGKKDTSNSSYSDWEIIESKFRNKTGFEKRVKPCKSIRDSVASTNARLCNTQGLRRQFANMNECTALVKDWELCKWKENSRELEEKDAMRGHACRAVDYYNDFEYPIKGVSKTEIRKGFDN